jgi:S1-C subfamily serine protease
MSTDTPQSPPPADDGPDLGLDPRTGPTRPRGHTLQDRLRLTAERRAQRHVRDPDPDPDPDAGLAALIDLLNNGPSVPPKAPTDPSAAVATDPGAAVPPDLGAAAVPTAEPILPAAPAPPVQLFRDDPLPPVQAAPPLVAPAPPVAPQMPSAPAPAPQMPVAPPAPLAPPAAPPAVTPAPAAFSPSARAEVPPPEALTRPSPAAREVPGLVPLPVEEVPDLEVGHADPGPGHDTDLDGDDADGAVETTGLRARRRMKKASRQAKRERRMERRRYRILPRTVIGITTMVLVAGLAAGATGAVLYAYYDWRLTQNEDRVGDLAEGLEGRLTEANTAIQNSTDEAVADVRAEGDALRELIEDQNAIAAVLPEVSPSVWFVSTLDDSGRSSVGSAFVVGADGEQSLLLTSYTTVAAASVDPAPEITLRKGDETMVATLYSWDPERDLALITVDRSDLTPLAWASEEQRAEAAGKRGFAVTGLGGADATVSPGQVLDLTATEIQHNIAIGPQFQGGPILSSDGKVLGVASLEYAPLNFQPGGGVTFGVPIGLACERVLTCNGTSPA